MGRLVTAALVALLACCFASPAVAARTVPQSFVGTMADGPLLEPSADLPGEMDLMVASGVESMRFVADWAAAQPYRGAPADYRAIDAVVSEATRRHLSLLPVVSHAPRWAAMRPARYSSPPADPRAYGRFVAALARRYGPGGAFWAEHPELTARPLRHWQLWNEPNLVEFWNRQPYARRYVALLRATRPRLRAVDPGARVVLAGLPNRSWEELDGLYRAGARGLFDIAAIHPFTATVPGVVTILGRARRVMRAHGDRRKPLWATEVSWTSARGKARFTYGNETTERGQARALERAYAVLARERRRLRLGRADWYTWVAAETDRDFPFDYAGLARLRPGETVVRKPAFRALGRAALGLEGCAEKGIFADSCAQKKQQ